MHRKMKHAGRLRKRATDSCALLWKMTYAEKAFYGSLPPCIQRVTTYLSACLFIGMPIHLHFHQLLNPSPHPNTHTHVIYNIRTVLESSRRVTRFICASDTEMPLCVCVCVECACVCVCVEERARRTRADACVRMCVRVTNSHNIDIHNLLTHTLCHILCNNAYSCNNDKIHARQTTHPHRLLLPPT